MKAGLTATFSKMLQYFFRVRLRRHRDLFAFLPAGSTAPACLPVCLPVCVCCVFRSRFVITYLQISFFLPISCFFLPRIGRLCLDPLPFVLFPVLVLLVSSLPPLLLVIPLLPFCRFPFLAFSFFCFLPFSSFGSCFTFAVLFFSCAPYPFRVSLFLPPFSSGRHRFLQA